MPNVKPHCPPALLASEELTLWGMGHHEQHAGMVTHAERRGYLLLFFDNDILLWSRGEERRSTAHSFLLLPPCEVLHCGLPQGCWEYSWVECRGTLLEELVETQAIPLDTLMPFAEARGLDDLLRLLSMEVRGRTPDGVTVRQLFHNCLVKIRRRALICGEARQIPPVLQEIQHYLNIHYPKTLRLGVLAHQFHLSPGYCCREFKRHFGVPPSQYLRRLRIEEAARLLRDTELPITVIASQVGYEDITYFSAHLPPVYRPQPKPDAPDGESNARRSRCRHACRHLPDGVRWSRWISGTVDAWIRAGGVISIPMRSRQRANGPRRKA